MRWVLTAFFLLLVSIVPAQQTNLKKQVRLQKGLVRIDAIVQCIHQQTALKFSFNSKQVSPSRKVMIPRSLLSVEEILLQVEKATGVKFKIVGGHIVLQNGDKVIKSKQPGAQPNTVKTIVAKRAASNKRKITEHRQSGKPQQNVMVSTGKLMAIEKSSIDEAVVDEQMRYRYIASINNVLDKPITSLRDITRSLPAINSVLIRPLLNTPPFQKNIDSSAYRAHGKKYWLEVGTKADETNEVFFGSPTLRLGYKHYYGLVNWNKQKFPYVQWGIGYTYGLSPYLQLSNSLTTGVIHAQYLEDALPPIFIKSKVYKWNIQFGKVTQRHFVMQVGPVVNVLHTKYFIYDQQGTKQPTAIGMLLPDDTAADKMFTTIKVPYNLLNTFKKETTANWKAWVGVEVGFYYKINFSLRK